MKIHKYNEEYAIKNGIYKDLELIIAILIATIGGVTPAILFGLHAIKFRPVLIIWGVTVLLCVYLIRRIGVINKSSMSVLIEDEGNLYYMMITPDLRQFLFPARYYEIRKTYAEIAAAQIAQDEETVKELFDLYKNGKLKTTFDTIMYGKPIYVFKILEENFKDDNKKIYKVNCLKDNGRKSTVKIPKVYPTFFM